MTMNLKKGADDSARAKLDNPIRSDYHALARSSSCEGHGVGKVPLLVGADATVVVHKEDGLVQKNASVEELRKPTGSNGGRESRRIRSPMEEEKTNALEVSSFDVDERLSFDSKKR
ncbi:hypothetical protein BHM03_00000062 [Ensete ventricosum]|uniref:Uncharacterized protein n=1 Tax=Ensete ventricosum TaxID=4639 RepID=A0A445M876_ENSVE|nr:hypothetical protein BHM03_00000062 [Ensete ventricosum]